MKLPCLVKVTVTDFQTNHYRQLIDSVTQQIFEQFGWLNRLREQQLEFKSGLSELMLKPLTDTYEGEVLECVVSLSDVQANFVELRYVLFRQNQSQASADFKEQIFCYDTHVQQMDWPQALKYELDAARFEQNWSEG